MKTINHSPQKSFPILFSTILVLLSFVSYALSAQPRVLYLYGDVSKDGDIPSGTKPPFHQMRLNDDGNLGMSQYKAALEAVGFQVDEAYDAEFELSMSTLEPYQVLILASNQRRFRDSEREATKLWVEKGNGLIAWSDSAFGGHFRDVGLGNEAGRLSDNDIMTQFGMYFMTDNGAGNYLVSQYEADHYLNNNNRQGGLFFRGEGVSPIRISPPATMLARLQDGGLGGMLRLNKVDGKYDPERDAALAIAEFGTGRVIGVFDRNLFWNAGAGTRLSHSDNREFAQRLVIWAAGLETQLKPDASLSPEANKNRNKPPQLTVQHLVGPDANYVDLTATVVDNDNDTITPEIIWRQHRGPGSAEFENNNSNGERIRVLLSEPGKYVYFATVRDGEFRIQSKVDFVKP